MSSKLTFCYIAYNEGMLTIYDDKPKEYISKMNMNRNTYKGKIIEEIYKVSDSPNTKVYYNIVELHSLYFTNKKLDISRLFKYILPSNIEIRDSKISTYLEIFWNIDGKQKIKEIENNKLEDSELSCHSLSILDDSKYSQHHNATSNILNSTILKEHNLLFVITHQSLDYLTNYNYPTDVCIIHSGHIEKHLILNNINRKTKKFNFVRKYIDNKIIPYLDEDNLEGYDQFDKTFINDTYENNIEINLNVPYSEELEKKFYELNK